MLLHLASYSQCQTIGKMASHLWIHEWCSYKPTTDLVGKCPIGCQTGMSVSSALPSACDSDAQPSRHIAGSANSHLISDLHAS